MPEPLRTNPFAPTSVPNEKVFGDAIVKDSSFLYRRFVIDRSLFDGAPDRSMRSAARSLLTSEVDTRSWSDEIEIVYNGWWFVQRILIDGKLVWWKISWLRIESQIQFQLPQSVSPRRDTLEVSIGFGRGLHIKRFLLKLGGHLVYEEVQ